MSALSLVVHTNRASSLFWESNANVLTFAMSVCTQYAKQQLPDTRTPGPHLVVYRPFQREKLTGEGGMCLSLYKHSSSCFSADIGSYFLGVLCLFYANLELFRTPTHLMHGVLFKFSLVWITKASSLAWLLNL